MKNTGMETPATEIAMMTRSLSRPRRTAAKVPSARPSGTAISMAPSINSTVGPMVSASSSLTILLEMIERPRSPRSTRPMYSANWMGIGRSSPSSRRMAAMVSALASGPAMIIAGSAGTTCRRQKQRNRTPSSAGNETSRRWTICLPMHHPRTDQANETHAGCLAGESGRTSLCRRASETVSHPCTNVYSAPIVACTRTVVTPNRRREEERDR